MAAEKKDEPKKEEIKYKKDDNIQFKVKDDELTGTIRWIGESEKWDKGIWIGIELDSENLTYGHNGYFNQERFFGCPANHGIYIREEQIIKINDSKNNDDKDKK
mmetsp:Transcript_24438/g.21358  ORF Transcript_24438/g.21358 Transcript_24438/m.21358 type:complete len:104 (+) Transcript_24438:129-440(+)